MTIEINDELLKLAFDAIKEHSIVQPPETEAEIAAWVNHLIYTETMRIKTIQY